MFATTSASAFLILTAAFASAPGCGQHALPASESTSGSQGDVLAAAPADPLAPDDHASSADKHPAHPQDSKWTQAELEAMAGEIKGDIEEMRGEKFKQAIVVKLASRDGFLQYAKDREAHTTSPEKVASDETIAKMLGMVPPKMNLSEAELAFLSGQVGGFYDPTTKSFCLMDACPQGVAKIVLAHELDHALDDQLFDIDGKSKALEDNSDATMAYQSVVEGTGTAVMTQWTLKHMKGVDLSGFQAMQDESNKSLAAAPMWLWKPALAVYLRGAAFLAHSDSVMKGQMTAAKNDDIRRAFTDVPRSMEQVLHPEKYWDESKRDDPRKVEFDATKLPEGWKVLREDTLGEFALAMLTTPEAERKPLEVENPMSILTIEFTNEAAKGWGGDRAILLGKDSARVLVLATCWDTPRDAAEFYGAMRTLEPQLTRAVKALAAEGDFGKHPASSVSVQYGDAKDEVVLKINCGVPKQELESVEKAITYRCAAAKTR